MPNFLEKTQVGKISNYPNVYRIKARTLALSLACMQARANTRRRARAHTISSLIRCNGFVIDLSLGGINTRKPGLLHAIGGEGMASCDKESYRKGSIAY